METIKSYTDISQSKKLAEILPLKSADMYYYEYTSHIDGTPKVGYKEGITEGIPCWSLAGLLDALPKDESIDCSISFGYYNGKGEYIEKWLCAFEKEGETTDDFIIETSDGDNPVDACVSMIEKLHELKML